MKPVTHKARHQACVAYVTLKGNALSYSSSHNGGSSSTECPVEEEHVPAAVISGRVPCAAECKVTTADEGVCTPTVVGAKGKAVAAKYRSTAG